MDKLDNLDLVELGTASEETRGNMQQGLEAGGFVRPTGLSDDD